jgi:hypothetical protein
LLHLSLGSTGYITPAPLELIFSDVWGSTPFFSDDFYYFIIFVGVHTKYGIILLLRSLMSSLLFINFKLW